MNLRKINYALLRYCFNMKKIAYLILILSTVLINLNKGFAQETKAKSSKAKQQSATGESESVKTMVEAIKSLFNKNKKQTTKKVNSKNSNSKKQIVKKKNSKETRAQKTNHKKQNAKRPVAKEGVKKAKPGLFSKTKQSKEKRTISSKNERGQLYIDTLYYIQPIPAQLNHAAISADELKKPISIDESNGKVREVEIGEHKDYFSFNTWEIPNQPDEYMKEKLESFPSILPLVFNDDVKQQIRELTHSNVNRRWIEGILGKTDMYFPLYEKVFDQYAIPVEMKYLSVIESGLNPKATSPMGAKGLWQFIPETAKHYGLKNNSLIDDARDPKKATRAAAKYLNKMYTEFGDWFLAMCAYNCGPGNVRKALRRSKDGSRDFWSIKKYLPRETRRYIPKFIAMVYVLNNYEAHNLKVKPLDYDLQKIDTIHLHQSVNTNDFVKYCGIKKEHIRLLNPILKTSETPVPNPTFVFNIPYSKLENVLNYRDEHMLRKKPKSNPTPDFGTSHLSGEIRHQVKSGESLDVISRKYGVSIADIKRWNGLKNDVIIIGQGLFIYK